MAYRVLDSSYLFEGRVFRVRVDWVQKPDASRTRVEIVEHGGSVAMIPIDEMHRIWFVRQYRHPAGENLLELPAGTIEAGEDPATCADRECREEIGMAPGRLEKLGSCFLAPGYSTELIHFFLARDLVPSSLSRDEDEDLTLEPMPIDQALQALLKGEFRDAKTFAGILLALGRLGRFPFSPS